MLPETKSHNGLSGRVHPPVRTRGENGRGRARKPTPFHPQLHRDLVNRRLESLCVLFIPFPTKRSPTALDAHRKGRVAWDNIHYPWSTQRIRPPLHAMDRLIMRLGLRN